MSAAQFGVDRIIFGAHNGLWLVKFGKPTKVEDPTTLPIDFQLEQNYPNPFNPSTTIEFALPERSFVKLSIYNTLGQEIETLVNEEKGVGVHRIVWNASAYPSGIYFYKLETSKFQSVKKMLLLK